MLLADPALRIALTTAIGALVCLSISMTAELFFAVDVLRAGQTGYGALLTAGPAAWSRGPSSSRTGCRPAGSRSSPWRASRYRAPACSAPRWPPRCSWRWPGFALGGLAHGVKNVALRTLIHHRVPDALRGRAFATYNGARNAAELGALGLGGALVGAVGARTALLLSGAVPLVLGLLGLALIQRSAAGACAASITTRRSIHAHVQG